MSAEATVIAILAFVALCFFIGPRQAITYVLKTAVRAGVWKNMR